MIVKQEDEDTKTWCESIAGIIVDAMLDAKLVDKAKFEKAVEIVSLELFVRITVGDYPPDCKPKQLK
jgi:hypothetical protein